MKKLVAVLAILSLLAIVAIVYAQGPGMMGGGMMGAGQKDQPQIGRGMMHGMGCYEREMSIPDKLQKPKSDEWVSKLKQILALEKLSQVQYEADSKKYQVHMPYRMVIPQEANHIEWINKLFAAYGLPSDVKSTTCQRNNNINTGIRECKRIRKESYPTIRVANKQRRGEHCKGSTGYHTSSNTYTLYDVRPCFADGLDERPRNGARHG